MRRQILPALAVAAAILIVGAALSYAVAGLLSILPLFAVRPPDVLMAVIPNLAYYGAAIGFAVVIGRGDARRGVMTCAALLLLLAFGPPFVINNLRDTDGGRVRDLAANASPVRTDTVMLLSPRDPGGCRQPTCVPLLLSGAARTVLVGSNADDGRIEDATGLQAWRVRSDASCNALIDDPVIFARYMTAEEFARASGDGSDPSGRIDACIFQVPIAGIRADLAQVRTMQYGRDDGTGDRQHANITQLFRRTASGWALVEQTTDDLGGGRVVAYPLTITGRASEGGIRSEPRKREHADPGPQILDMLIRDARGSRRRQVR